MTRMVDCVKLGRKAEGLERPPVPGKLGARIFENVSKEAWQQWVRYQTMLINENRLNLMEPRARQYLSEQMEKHFFSGEADRIPGFAPPVS
ncbi:MAG: oxidative damage protection protein [Azoarcus sp.]|jgi:Fe-S cluster biosynthesis and repair protein YggX|nr:oxidative damage protection protein [Azoarcus sp.]